MSLGAHGPRRRGWGCGGRWVAHEAERALAAGTGEVPEDWGVHRDRGTGVVYYHNHAIGRSSWAHPLEVPAATDAA